MSTGFPLAVNNGSVDLISRADLERLPAWRETFATQSKDHRYYDIVEHTLEGFEHRYLVFKDNAGVVRGIQPVFFLRQNLVEGMRGKFRSIVETIRRKFPRFLTMRVLMVGCAAGEGHLGSRSPQDEAWVSQALHASLQSVARQGKASLIVLKDFSSCYRPALQNFSINGYTRVPSMPMTRLSLRHASFDDYLATIGYVTRKSLRRKLRKTDRTAKITMETLTDITPYLDEIYPLYLQVHERSSMKFERLTKQYFQQLAELMPDRVQYFIWRQQDEATERQAPPLRIIAFSCCIIHDGKIYDECLGLDYKVALDLHLYFYTLRDVLTWGMKHGLTEYISAPLNYDPKLHLGCELMPLDLYVRHTAPVLNAIFGRILPYLEPTRHDPVLRRFPNADAMLN